MDLFPETLDPDTPHRRTAESAHGDAPAEHQPLAERMRPRNFEEWVGQRRAAGPGSALRRLLELSAPAAPDAAAAGESAPPPARAPLPSMILWGPPGCGKTTLARLLARQSVLAFEPLSAVTSGVKEVKEVIERARARRRLGHGTLLFIDEIHRFNKAQQDAFLPHVETGTITLVGATTENPSFAVIAPLLSRCRVVTLEALSAEDLLTLLQRALADEPRGLGTWQVAAEPELLERIAAASDGDARRALGLLEHCAMLARTGQAPHVMRADQLRDVLERDHLFYDRAGEEHFNLISAFHKSMRASDPQGAVYWLFRMLEAGENPLWIARRIVACASEDVGMADPQALQIAVAALQAFQNLGLPEGELPLTHATIYVATAPKSNSVNVAREAARAAAREHGPLAVPLHLRNAPTGLMKSLGYGREYIYDHDAPDHFSGQPCLPDALHGTTFYEPGEFGFEKEIKKRIDWWDKKRVERAGEATESDATR